MDKLNKALVLWFNQGHEKYWLDYIFNQIFDTVLEFRDINQLLDHDSDSPLFVVVNNPLQKRFERLLYAKRKFFLINLGDEFIPTKQDHSVYDNPFCLHVFRNYYRSSDNVENVTAFPLGYGGNFNGGISALEMRDKVFSADRGYLWSFAGVSKKSSRMRTISRFSSLHPHFFYSTSKWMAENALSCFEYRDLLLNSFVVPAPRGNCNLDCFRLYEALEAGCIPLIEKDSSIQSDQYFLNLLGSDCPILSLPDLRSPESVKFLKTIQADISLRETIRIKIINWWVKYKRNMLDSFKVVIKNYYE